MNVEFTNKKIFFQLCCGIRKRVLFGLAGLLFIVFGSVAQVNGDWQSNADGSWSNAGGNIWQKRVAGAWVTQAAGQYPGLNSGDLTITILNSHNIIMDVSPSNAIGALTINSGNSNSDVTISGSNSLTITGALTTTGANNGVNKLFDVAGGTLTVGSISITGGGGSKQAEVALTAGTINCSGNITFSGTASNALLTFNGAGTLNIGGASGIGSGGTFTASTGTVNYNLAGAQIVGGYTYNNLTLSGSGAKTTTGVTVNGILSLQGTATTTGTVATYGASSTLQYKGSASQTTGTEFSTPFSGSGGLIIDNSNGVILNAAKVLSSTAKLTLTSGILTTTAANSLTVNNTATTGISGGSTTCFVSGPLLWILPASLSLSASVYNFPVGKGGIYYPFSLTNLTTGGTGPTITVEAFSANAGGSAGASLSSVSTTEYWSASYTGNYTDGSVSLTRQSALGSNNAVARSATKTGTYSSLYSASTSGTTINNSISTGTTLDFFVMGVSAACVAPSTQANTITFAGITPFTIPVSWTNGNGSYRMVVAKQGSAPAGTPVDGTIYTANAAFGSGSTIAAGEYVVYLGTASTVTVTSLTPSTSYYFQVYEFNCGASSSKFKTTTGASNPNNTSTINSTYYSIATGNWNANTTWSLSSGGAAVGAGIYPVAGDIVNIENGRNVTVNVNSAAASISFNSATSANTTLSISSGITLTISGAITIPRGPGGGGGKTNTVAVGAGFLNAGSISFTNGGTAASGQRHVLTISTGTATVTGNCTDDGSSTGSATVTFTSTGKLKIGGAFLSTSNGTFTASTGTVEYNAAGAQAIGNFTYNNLTLSTSGAKTTTGATVNGILSLEGTATTAGTVATYGASSSLQYKGSASQTTGTEFSTPFSGTGGLIIDNASGVILNAAKVLSAASKLTLTNGILTTTAVNTLTVNNTATTGISGGSTSCFVSGPLIWVLPGSLSSSASVYNFPVGKGATYYPFSLTTLTTGATGPTLTVEAFNANAGGSADGTTVSAVSTTEYWSASFINNFTDASVSLTRQAALGAMNVISRSATKTGSYASLTNTSISGTTINNSTATGNTLGFFAMATAVPCSAPTTQASNITFGTVTTSTIPVNWTNGNGTYRIVVAKSGSTPSGTPVDGTVYTANAAFGSGSTIATGEYVVYNGSASTVTVTGLSKNTVYYFQVYEYNCTGTLIKYKTTTAASNPNSINTPYTYYSIATGNWNTNTTWSFTSAGVAVGAGLYPVTGDSVIIERGNNVTVTADAGCRAIAFTTTTATTLTVNSGVTLTVASAVTIPRSGSGINVMAVGDGNLVAGSVYFSSAGTNSRHKLSIATGTATISGNITQSGTKTSPAITFTGSGKLRLGGTMLANNRCTFTASTGTVEYYASGAQTVSTFTYNNLTLSGSGAKATSGGTVNGILSMEGIATTSGSAVTYGASSTLQYKGTASQTTGTEFSTPFAGTGGLVINNSNGVILNAAKVLSSTSKLTLTSGVLTTTAVNTLTINNTATTGIGGGSTSSYVDGPLKWILPASLSSSASVYSFPLGKSGVYYPFSLTSLTTGGTGPTITVEAFAANAGGSADGTTVSALSTTEYWLASFTGNYTDGSVSLTRQAALGTMNVVARSATKTGTYASLYNTTVSGTTINNSVGTGNTLNYFTMGAGIACAAPGTQSSNIVFGTVTKTTIPISSWTVGTGTYRIVVARQGSAPAGVPVDGTVYTANAAFGSGSTIATGEYVVYNGSSNTVTVTGLTANTTYYFEVFEYNCSGTFTKYKTTTAANNPKSTTTSANVTYFSINAGGNWNANSSWSLSSGGAAVGAGIFPTAGDSVVMENGKNITVNVDAACAGITFMQGTTNNTSLSISSGVTLAVSNSITIPRGSTSSKTNTLAVGAGILTATGIAFTNGSSAASALHALTISTGTATISGDITHTGSTGSATITFSNTGTLKVGGAFLAAAAVTFTASTGTVEYNGTAAQTVQALAYRNLTLSGGSVKTLAANTSMTAVLTVNAGTTLANGGFTLGSPTSTVIETVGAGNGSIISGTGLFTLGGNVTLNYTGSGAITTGALISCPVALTNATTRTFTVADDVSSSPADLTISGLISTTGALTKAGAGTLNLSGFNTYSGLTTVSAGTLQLGAAGDATNTPLGTTGGATTVSAGAALDLNGFTLGTAEGLTLAGTGIAGAGALVNNSATTAGYSGLLALGSSASIVGDVGIINISNAGTILGPLFGLTLGGAAGGSISSIIGTTSGSVTITDAGTWTLSGVNTYTGGTTLGASATLNINNAQALGTAAGTFVINGGTIDNTSGAAITTLSYPMTWNTAFVFSGTKDLNLGSGNVTMTADVDVTTDAGTLTVDGVIAGAFNLSKDGAGALSMSAVNTFTGGTTLNAGTLNINSARALGAAAGTFIINGGTIDNITVASVTTSNYPITVNGDFSYLGTRALNLGTGTVTLGASVQVTTTANTLTIGGTINNNAVDITKAGAGTLAFISQAVTLNNFTLSAGTLTSTSGNLSLAGNLTNNATFTDNGGTVIFNGGSAQQIRGSNTAQTFNNITVSNTAGDLTLNNGGSVTVGGTLNFTSGNCILGLNNLLISSGNAITGYTSTSFVVTNNTGYLQINNVGIVSGSRVFPIGYSAASYTPVIVDNTGAGAVTDNFYAVVFDNAYSGGTRGNGGVVPSDIVAKTWQVEEGTVGGSNATLTVQWNGTDELSGFTNSNCGLSHYVSGAWDTPPYSAAAGSDPFTQSRSGITSFSPFAVERTAHPLPIQLLSFNARPANGVVELSWSTATETNNNFFTIERSQDGKNFTALKVIPGAGNSAKKLSYSTVDEQPYTGTSYYRLKQTDYDGKYSRSSIVAVQFNSTETVFTVFPNPTSAGETPFIKFNVAESTNVLVVVNDVTGREIYSKIAVVEKGQGEIVAIDLSSKLIPGLYFISASSDNAFYRQRLIIK